MTSYKLIRFTIADAHALAGKTADITEWDDDELETKVTYPGARVTAIIDRISPCLVIETAGAVVTDARTGEGLGIRPPEPELHVLLTWVCEVDGVRGRSGRGDRVALEHAGDPCTALRSGDEETVTRYDPEPGQLSASRDSGRTRPMLPGDGDRIRLIAPVSGEGAGPVSSSSPQPAAPDAVLRQAGDLGRRHGRAAVHWQIGDSSSGRESWQELLAGIASADPVVTGRYEVPDLTARWEYELGNLAADLQLPDGDPAVGPAAEAYLAAAREEFWREAARLARRRLAPGAGGETQDEDGIEPEDGEAAPDRRQDISDPATGLSRLLSERCGTCILSPGDPMHLGPERTAAFIRHALAERSYVVCHETLTYGDFPGYGPAICRGFFDAYRTRSAALLILQAGRHLTEVPPPLVARAAELRRNAGKTAAGQGPGGNTPGEQSQRAQRGTEEGDPAVPGATGPPAIGPAAGYHPGDLARDLGIEPQDRALPRAVSAYADALHQRLLAGNRGGRPRPRRLEAGTPRRQENVIKPPGLPGEARRLSHEIR